MCLIRLFPFSLTYFGATKVNELFAVSQLCKCGLIFIAFYVGNPCTNIPHLISVRQMLQLFCLWTLFISCFYLKDVSETGFCHHIKVEPTQLSPIDRASPYLRTPAPAQIGYINQACTTYLREVR
jgi:hypothetical protein